MLNFYLDHYYSLWILLPRQASLEDHNMLSHEFFNASLHFQRGQEQILRKVEGLFLDW